MKNIFIVSLWLFLLLWCNNESSQTDEINNQQNTEKNIENHISQDTDKKDINKNNWTENIQNTVCLWQEEVQIYTYMYHYIRNKNWDDPNAGFIRNAVITENFEAQMKKFQELEDQEKIKIIFLSELEKFQSDNCFPHKNLVIFTSDDGWDDNYINLFPIAEKYDIKFHLSIISDYTQKQRYDNFMTQDEVIQVSNHENFEIIWHTFRHLDLRTLNDFYLEREICQSKTDLEKLIGKNINSLVYPAWKYNQWVIQKALSCWYTFGFTTQSWFQNWEEFFAHPFEAKRIRVSRGSTVKNLTSYFEEEKNID